MNSTAAVAAFSGSLSARLRRQADSAGGHSAASSHARRPHLPALDSGVVCVSSDSRSPYHRGHHAYDRALQPRPQSNYILAAFMASGT